MQLIPETEKNRSLTETARHNLEQNDIHNVEPNRVLFGHTPRGGACVDETADTIFVGSELMLRQDRPEIIMDLEHELIHYAQFENIFGEAPEGYHDARRELEQRALSQALQIFDHSYIEQFSSNENVHWGNFPLMLALSSGEDEFLDPIERIYSGREMTADRLEEIYHEIESRSGAGRHRRMTELRSELTREEAARLGRAHGDALSATALKKKKFVEEAEEYVQDRWQELVDSEATDFAQPLIERYTPENGFRDDIVEAQAQFWSYFRVGALEDIEDYAPEIYPKPLEDSLESTETAYRKQRWYTHGDNIRPELENRIENYRELVSDGEDPYDAAARIVNADFERMAS